MKLGEGLCIFISFHFLGSGCNLLNSFYLFIFFFFLWCDNETQQKVLWLLQNTNSIFCEIRIGYHKIPKISPRAYIFQRPFLRGLSTEGKLCFKIDWASLIVVCVAGAKRGGRGGGKKARKRRKGRECLL